jgi:predicted lysophospholipase L1 biosynthesis ABC-type transport system permease subunit
MRLVFPRALAARTLLVAAAVAALVTTVLLTAFLQYAYLLPQAGVRQAVSDAPALERSVLLTSSAGRTADELTARDQAARDLFGAGLAGVPLAVYSGGYGISQRLPDDLPGVEPGPHGVYAVVSFLPELAEHVELVAGDWPRPVGVDEPAQAVLPADVAATLELSVGDQVPIMDEIVDEARPVEVVGLWQPLNPDDAYWLLAAGPISQGGWGPFVVHRDEFTTRYQRLATLEWVAVADPAALARAGMPEVAAGTRALHGELERRRDDDRVALDATSRIRTALDQLSDRLVTATVVNRSGLVLPAALLAVIAGYGLLLLARLLAAHRQGENALLRARGGSRRQLIRFTSAEALLVVVPAAVLGPVAGTWLVRVADERAGSRSLGLSTDLAGYGWSGPPMAWGIAAVAALGCALALAIPAAGRGRTWVAEQQERSRPSKAAMVQRAGLDIALVALAVLSWFQLRQYGQAVGPRDVGGFGVDPLLVAAPVVAVLAATAVALRVLPLATRLGVRLASRRNAFPGLLGMWQADRRPHAGPVLLLVLAVATAVLAPTVAATWQESQRDQARQAVGADLRLSGTDPRLDSQVRALSDLPEVTALMVGHRRLVRLPDGRRVPLLAVDSPQAINVVQLRDDVSPTGQGDAFEALYDGRPQVAGLVLPEGAQRLVGTLRFEAPAEVVWQDVFRDQSGNEFTVEVTQPGPTSFRPSVHVSDDRGLVSSMQLGQLTRDGPTHFEVPLPPGTTALIGLGAGLILPIGFDAGLRLEPESDPEPIEVSWRWETLEVIDEAGRGVPLELPDTWQVVYHPDQPTGETVPELERAGSDGVSVEVLQGTHRAQSVPFLLTDPIDVPTAPALFTPETLAAVGGDDIGELEVGGVAVWMAGTLPALPGIADGQGVAVDLAWMSLQRFREMRTPPAPNEWWLTTSDDQQVLSAAAGLSLTASRQQAEANRLLQDPLGSGVLLTLWAAAAGAAVLAAFGLAVDSRANAVRRRRELAVLHTLGVSPAGLARALVVEQAVLAGLGVVAGVAVGIGVAAAMGTSLVLTPAGAVPVPEPLLTLSPAQFAAPTAGLWVVAVLLGALVARRARREVAAGALRIGED